MIRPRGQLVLVERLPEREELTTGGLHLPEEVGAAFSEYRILAIGPGCHMDSGGRAEINDVAVGDTVLVRNNPSRDDRGQQVRGKHMIPVNPNQTLFLVSETECIAVIEADEPAITGALA